eukprot:EC850950.1.p1 GENE.EC850950.1~~EC850950.1.p1  ORF type:complete len:143 (+),score=25.93 EC850950.1:43-471(+)
MSGGGPSGDAAGGGSKPELLFKILVVGDVGTGKTSIIRKYVECFSLACLNRRRGCSFVGCATWRSFFLLLFLSPSLFTQRSSILLLLLLLLLCVCMWFILHALIVVLEVERITVFTFFFVSGGNAFSYCNLAVVVGFIERQS